MKLMCDPPSGWKYGFPKEVPADWKEHDDWLICLGYPAEEIDKYGKYFYVRYWYENNEANLPSNPV